MSFTTDLLAGVAQYLEDGAVGTWKATGTYVLADPNPIVIAAVPASPDRVITLTAYSVDDDEQLADSTQGLQVRCRGTSDPRTASDLDDAVFDRLHAAGPLTLGGVPVVGIRRVSSAPLGPDGNGRHEISSNYYITVARPSQHRPD